MQICREKKLKFYKFVPHQGGIASEWTKSNAIKWLLESKNVKRLLLCQWLEAAIAQR